MVEQSLGLVQQQRMEQSLTPQMIQSLKILQLPILDLQLMVREEMDQNPTLDRDASEVEEIIDFEETARDELRDDREIDELTEIAEWDEDFRRNQISMSKPDEDKHQFMMDSISNIESLQDHLTAQASLVGFDKRERGIADVIIGSIDDDGYLQIDLDGIIGATPEFPEELFERITTIIQSFDPIGVGARSLEECLLIQLRHQGRGDSLEAQLIRNHLDHLGNHRYEKIATAMRLPLEKIKELSKSIADLDPKPGRNFAAERTEYVIPEITVEKRDGVWTVTQNKSLYPHLFISTKYLQLMKEKTTTDETRKYIREKIAKSKFFIRSIDQRQNTIHRIATEIVRVQERFFEHGIKSIQPLKMKSVAEIIGVHEATVSRACNGKYMATPQGTFEFKHFFTTAVVQTDGTVISNAVIKSTLGDIVRDEDKKKPLSDQKLVYTLSEQGINIARRTVAKYRGQLNILPARLRRQT